VSCPWLEKVFPMLFLMLGKSEDVPEEIRSTIFKCLNADQRERYRDASDLKSSE